MKTPCSLLKKHNDLIRDFVIKLTEATEKNSDSLEIILETFCKDFNIKSDIHSEKHEQIIRKEIGYSCIHAKEQLQNLYFKKLNHFRADLISGTMKVFTKYLTEASELIGMNDEEVLSKYISGLARPGIIRGKCNDCPSPGELTISQFCNGPYRDHNHCKCGESRYIYCVECMTKYVWEKTELMKTPKMECTKCHNFFTVKHIQAVKPVQSVKPSLKRPLEDPVDRRYEIIRKLYIGNSEKEDDEKRGQPPMDWGNMEFKKKKV
jgi:hypothetical protein